MPWDSGHTLNRGREGAEGCLPPLHLRGSVHMSYTSPKHTNPLKMSESTLVYISPCTWGLEHWGNIPRPYLKVWIGAGDYSVLDTWTQSYQIWSSDKQEFNSSACCVCVMWIGVTCEIWSKLYVSICNQKSFKIDIISRGWRLEFKEAVLYINTIQYY